MSAARSRSPCSTTMSTADWLSSAVLNISVRRAGIVVLRSMTLVITPPSVSTPSDSGVTSSSRTSLTSPLMIAGLDRGADRDDLVGVDGHVRVLAAGQPAHQVLHGGDPGRAADEDDLVDVVGGDLGVGHRLLDRAEAALDEVGGDLLERRAHERRDQVLGPVGVGGDERQVDLRLGHRGQLDLGLLGRLEQPLQRLRVLAQVDAVLRLELVGQVVDEPAVEVVAAEVGVAGRWPAPRRRRRRRRGCSRRTCRRRGRRRAPSRCSFLSRP